MPTAQPTAEYRPLDVRQVPGKGRGCFATRTFLAGEIIETAPVLVIPKAEWKHISRTIVFHYAFAWGEDNQDAALALGHASLCNHSYSPNANYEKCYDSQVIEVVALRTIKKGEEILVNYNGDPTDKTPVWFDVLESTNGGAAPRQSRKSS